MLRIQRKDRAGGHAWTGTDLGLRFEQIARITQIVREPEQLSVCFDTCHPFGAGYDIRTKKTYTAAMREFDGVIGLEHLSVIHLYDPRRRSPRGFPLAAQRSPVQGDSHAARDPQRQEAQGDIESLGTLRSLIGKSSCRLRPLGPWVVAGGTGAGETGQREAAGVHTTPAATFTSLSDRERYYFFLRIRRRRALPISSIVPGSGTIHVSSVSR